MAISRNLPSKTLEEIMSEVGSGEPVDPTFIGSAQVLPVVGDSVTEIAADFDEPWVDVILPAESGEQ